MNKLLAFCLIIFVRIQEVNAGTILNDTFKLTKSDIRVTKYAYVEPGQDAATFVFELGELEDYPILPETMDFNIIIQKYTINVYGTNSEDAICYWFTSPTNSHRYNYLCKEAGININNNRFLFYDKNGNFTFDGNSDSKFTPIGSAQNVPGGSSYFSVKLDGDVPLHFAMKGVNVKGYVPDPKPTKVPDPETTSVTSSESTNVTSSEPTKEPAWLSFSANFNAMSLIVLFGVVVLQKAINTMM